MTTPYHKLSETMETSFPAENSSVVLMTDFGLRDSYVGQLRGVLLGLNPQLQIIDLTHAIPPQDVLLGAITLADSLEAFTPGTIFLTVVDPGVGSDRRMLAAEIGDWKFVAPDNGLLTGVLRNYPIHRAFTLENPRYRREKVSGTFHGRDIFAPAAAHWSLGVDPAHFGPIITDHLVELPWPEVIVHQSGLRGEVLMSDHFGNLLTNIMVSDLPRTGWEALRIVFVNQQLMGIKSHYAEGQAGQPMALISSSGRLEIAIPGGNAASFFQLAQGVPVKVSWPT